MKKVLGAMAGILFSVFCIAILGLLMSFTLGALRKLFPDSFTNQMWGLVLFDIGAMIWGLAFVFKSESVGQYAAAGIGFATAFIGTLLMVTFEVMSSGQTYVELGDMGRWVVYGFIIVTAVHAALVYFHHAASPDIAQKINIGIAKGDITSEGIRQATSTLDDYKRSLATSISKDITDNALRDLGINIAVEPGVGFVPVTPAPQNATTTQADEQKKNKSWFAKFKDTLTPAQKKAAMKQNEQTVVDVPKLKKDGLTGDEPWDYVNHDLPNVLPCGHVRGCVNNWSTGGYDCAVCGLTIEKGHAPNGNEPYRVPAGQPMPDKSKQPKMEEPRAGGAPFPGE